MNLIVYGSLLNKNELKKHNISLDNIEYVKVYGFRRVFNQLPSWRKTEGNKKAVLNIEYNRDFWFNAILIKNLTKEYFKELDIREKGYNRVDIKSGNVVTYKGDIIKNAFVYVGKEGKQDNNILPNPSYYQICYNGAKEHFKEFFQDYLNTTYQNSQSGIVKIST